MWMFTSPRKARVASALSLGTGDETTRCCEPVVDNHKVTFEQEELEICLCYAFGKSDARNLCSFSGPVIRDQKLNAPPTSYSHRSGKTSMWAHSAHPNQHESAESRGPKPVIPSRRRQTQQ
ncbi:hypothetical protein ASPZODRAFT_1593994 [Penicilliopsis zonata CBS 506.65]|uniref:Uncharacterized protein n=1 Tax=Penicilliopsis zonata CBS 506.65 TaxID=1073090 RepID=A0A1L9SMT9_9EURO|nr:hypothetical protein ASPZODRAFT_1593994 [Penicilliopsis zonata CBS 506.65]OJJ48426.1 hypothetical protein ASPZODRAFT_1593994 [Penicilliopsis zonata CBS 506.65]